MHAHTNIIKKFINVLAEISFRDFLDINHAFQITVTSNMK